VTSAETAGRAAPTVLLVLAGPADADGGLLDRLAVDTVVQALVCTPGAPSDESGLAAALGSRGMPAPLRLGTPPARVHDSAPRRYVDGVPGYAPDALADATPGEVAADLATAIATTDAEALILPRTSATGAALLRDAAERAAEVMGVPGLQAEGAELAPLRAPGEWSPGDRVPEDRAPEQRWGERSLGRRVATLVGALVGGALVGVIGTIGFQVTLGLGEVPVPVGLVLALVVVGALLAGSRIVTGTRLVPAAIALGLLGTIALLSLESPGGSILVPDVALSYWWVYDPPALALVVLGWPGNHRRARVRIDTAPPTEGPRTP